jgi:hypothetical protein
LASCPKPAGSYPASAFGVIPPAAATGTNVLCAEGITKVDIKQDKHVANRFKVQVQDLNNAGLVPLEGATRMLLDAAQRDPEFVSLISGFRANVPQYRVQIDRAKAKSMGVSMVDIGETLEQKIAAIRCYQTQFPPGKAHVFDRIRGAAMLSGAAASFAAGETFVSTRPLGALDLVKTVLPRMQAT